MTSLNSSLHIRVEERNALLQNITERLQSNPRVLAAWLFGSIGRGEQDALSDLDIFVVVEDAHSEEVNASISEFVAPFGELLLVVEAPQNGPRGGAYLMALYAGETGPHQVDWYWQAHSRARIPAQTIVLFDKVGLLQDANPTTFDDMNPGVEWEKSKAITNAVCFFWAMLLITAKYAYRSPHEPQMGLLPYVLNPLREAAEFVESTTEHTAEGIPPHLTFAEKLALLRTLAAEMKVLLPKLAERGITVSDGIIPQVAAYFQCIETAHQQRSEEANV